MTTLAIIGSGIAGRSLVYSLAREGKLLEKIVLFSSDHITSPCTFNSTAVAAPRGVTKGHSALGDLLVEGLAELTEHVRTDRPLGVTAITQYNAAMENLDVFSKRFPRGTESREFFRAATYTAEEPAFLFDTRAYGDWLLSYARAFYGTRLEEVSELVTGIRNTSPVGLTTLQGRVDSFDRVVFAGGAYNRFWKSLAPDTELATSRPVQGSYLEYQNVSWDRPSFSLTIEGDTIVWNRALRRLFVGSTTEELGHLFPPLGDLRSMHQRLVSRVVLPLPSFEEGLIRVGLREKAKRRAPYLVERGGLVFMGGLYKNAFTVSLKISRALARQLP